MSSRTREIIVIDEEKCNGCGDCVPSCEEGAIQIIDGKARLVSDIMCDGLGACLGYCPEDAISIEEREAEEYNENRILTTDVRDFSIYRWKGKKSFWARFVVRETIRVQRLEQLPALNAKVEADNVGRSK